MDNKSNKPLNFTLWTAGIGIIILTLSSIIGKIREAIISEKNILTIDLTFNTTIMKIILMLSLIFLVVYRYRSSSKIVIQKLKEFISWALELFIGAILIYFFILIGPNFFDPRLKVKIIIGFIIAIFSIYLIKEELKVNQNN